MPLFQMPTMNVKKRTPGLMLKNEQPRMNPELAQASYNADEELPEPQIGPEPMQPEEKAPFGQRLKQSLFGSSQDSGVDELGVERPDVKKSGLFTKASRMILPLAVGMSGGLGLLPSLAAGYLSNKNAEEGEGEYDQALYNKKREKAFSQMKDLSKDQFEREKLGVTKDHYKAMEAIAAQRVGDDYDLNKIYVKSAVPKLVNKQSILNTLKSSLDEYDSALKRGDEEQAYIIGQRALKTINSPEGADAIGKEESERLGSQLNMLRTPFKIPGDIGVGRKLPEFGTSLRDTIDVLEGSVGQNVDQINNPSSIFDKQTKQKSQPAQRTTKSGLKYEVIE